MSLSGFMAEDWSSWSYACLLGWNNPSDDWGRLRIHLPDLRGALAGTWHSMYAPQLCYLTGEGIPTATRYGTTKIAVNEGEATRWRGSLGIPLRPEVEGVVGEWFELSW